MSNIHNNSILKSSTANSSMRPGEAQNESNGLGSGGYFAVGTEYEEQEEEYVDRSAYLMSALSGLATINSSKLYVKSNIMKKLAAKQAQQLAIDVA